MHRSRLAVGLDTPSQHWPVEQDPERMIEAAKCVSLDGWYGTCKYVSNTDLLHSDNVRRR